MNKFSEIFKGFFMEGSQASMARFLSFVCGIAAFFVSIGALWMGLQEKLTYDYVVLAGVLWSAAFAGKNWSKNVELKSKKEDGENR